MKEKFLFKKYENNPILKPNPANEWEEKCVLNPAEFTRAAFSRLELS